VKSLVTGLGKLVQRAPILVIIVAVVVSFGLGVFGADFNNQGTGGNEAFAPDTPELLASERIADLFSGDTGQLPLQFLVTSDSGDVLTLDGLAAMNQLAEFLAGSAIASDLVPGTPEQPSFNSFMFPVQAAVAQGAPAPTDDASVKAAFSQAIEQLPDDQAFFVDFLFPMNVDLSTASSDKALGVAFLTAPGDDEVDVFVERLAAMADEVATVSFSGDLDVSPFSIELIFSTQDEFQSEVGRLFGTAFLIIIIVLILVFWVGGFGKGLRRTLADMALTMFTIVLALQWVWGFWKLLYGTPNPMSQIIPILLIGLGVDYSIHLTTRYREELSDGLTVDAAIGLAIRTVGISLVLATVTTAVGFLTNITNDIGALQSFGVLSAVGIIASFLLMLTFVPAVRTLLDRRAEANGTLPVDSFKSGENRLLPRIIGNAAVIAERAPAVAITVALVLGAIGAFGVTKLDTSFSFLDFVPTSSPIRDTAEILLDEFFVVGEATQILVEGDITSGDAWNAMAQGFVAAGGVQDVVAAPGPGGAFPVGSSPVSLVAQLANPDTPLFVPAVGQAAAAAGLGPDLTVSAGDVTPVYNALVAAVPGQAGAVLHESAGGGYDAALFDLTTSGGEAGAAALRTGLTDAFAPVEAAGIDAIVTSNNIINDVIITSLRDSQVSSLAITLIAATILLVISFGFERRRPFLGVITALPVILVVVWSLGIMAGLGIPFGPVTATISALAIGIGIPYTIHITRRYLEDQQRFATAEEAIRSTTMNTGGALAGSAITTMAGFGILVTSTTIPFQQFGLVTAYTIGLSLIGAVLVLPPMLVLWDRWHRRRRAHEREAVEAHL